MIGHQVNRPRAGGAILVKSRRMRGAVRRPRAPEELLVDALRIRWRVFLSQLGQCRKRCSEPAVHDLRVATRRCIAALDLLATVSFQVGKTRQQLKRLLKSMGPLRDTQVQISLLQKLTKDFPELELLSTVLLLREQRALKRISNRIASLHTRLLQQRINAGVRGFEKLMRRPAVRPALALTLQGSLAAEFIRVVELRQGLNRLDPATIHSMRVAFKKFRYAIEILRPDMEARLHVEMNAFQTRMGDIHDLEVLRASIRQFTARVPRSPRRIAAPQAGRTLRKSTLRAESLRRLSPRSLDLARVERRLRERYASLVRKLMASADEVYRFYEAKTVVP